MSEPLMPSYNPGASAEPSILAPARPKQVGWAVLLIIAAAVFQIIAAVLGIVHTGSAEFRSQLTSQLAQQNIPDSGQDLVGISIGVALATIIVISALAVIVYVIIALFINKGAGWAKITAAVLAAVSLFSLAGLTMPAAIFVVLQILCGIAAVVLCFIKPGSRYFTDRKNFRLANKVH